MLRAMPWNYELFIDGKWTSEGATGTIDVIDPATEEVIGSVPEASVGTAQRAIEAARIISEGLVKTIAAEVAALRGSPSA